MASRTVSSACLIALCAAAGAQAQTSLSQVAELSAQTFLSGSNLSILDDSGDSAAPTRVQESAALLPRFDAAQGVLTGVQATLSIDPGQTLAASRGVDGGNYVGRATLSSLWSFGTTPAASVGKSFFVDGLARLDIDRDTPSRQTSSFGTLDFSASAAQAEGFVGSTALQSTVETSLSAFKEPGAGGNGGVTATVLPGGAAGFTGTLRLQYDYLAHARGSFDGQGAQGSLQLQAGAQAASFNVFALGHANTTRLDLLGVDCSGDCGLFNLTLAPFGDLLAGNAVGGSIATALPGAAGSATYTLSLSDDTSVGAAASRLTQSLTLSVSSVPEPGSAALLLAGLALLGRRALRRA